MTEKDGPRQDASLAAAREAVGEREVIELTAEGSRLFVEALVDPPGAEREPARLAGEEVGGDTGSLTSPLCPLFGEDRSRKEEGSRPRPDRRRARCGKGPSPWRGAWTAGRCRGRSCASTSSPTGGGLRTPPADCATSWQRSRTASGGHRAPERRLRNRGGSRGERKRTRFSDGEIASGLRSVPEGRLGSRSLRRGRTARRVGTTRVRGGAQLRG